MMEKILFVGSICVLILAFILTIGIIVCGKLCHDLSVSCKVAEDLKQKLLNEKIPMNNSNNLKEKTEWRKDPSTIRW